MEFLRGLGQYVTHIFNGPSPDVLAVARGVDQKMVAASPEVPQVSETARQDTLASDATRYNSIQQNESRTGLKPEEIDARFFSAAGDALRWLPEETANAALKNAQALLSAGKWTEALDEAESAAAFFAQRARSAQSKERYSENYQKLLGIRSLEQEIMVGKAKELLAEAKNARLEGDWDAAFDKARHAYEILLWVTEKEMKAISHKYGAKSKWAEYESLAREAHDVGSLAYSRSLLKDWISEWNTKTLQQPERVQNDIAVNARYLAPHFKEFNQENFVKVHVELLIESHDLKLEEVISWYQDDPKMTRKLAGICHRMLDTFAIRGRQICFTAIAEYAKKLKASPEIEAQLLGDSLWQKVANLLGQAVAKM